MKKFDDLSKNEREKLSIYLQYVNFSYITTIMFVLFGLGIFVVGTTFIVIFSLATLVVAGFALMAIGYVFVIAGLINRLTDRKHLFLIFGYKNFYSDIFNISKSDLKKVKIEREVKWKVIE